MNQDPKVIDDFGDEWRRYNYQNFDRLKLEENFQQYFAIFPWHLISKTSEGFDMGCGSGRWAHFVAPRVGLLNCVEPSAAIDVAKKNLAGLQNINYYKETTEECSIRPGSQDFGYCLGVLHHIPQTEEALLDCAKLLKPGAPMLLYLYYNFENGQMVQASLGDIQYFTLRDFKITKWRQKSYLRGHSTNRLLAVGQILIGRL